MNVIEKVKKLKSQLLKEGFVIDGVFGSIARGEKEYNDIDLLYHLDESFIKRYRGFIGFKKLNDIKGKISKELGVKVDLAPKNNLSNTAKKYILKDIIYV